MFLLATSLSGVSLVLSLQVSQSILSSGKIEASHIVFDMRIDIWQDILGIFHAEDTSTGEKYDDAQAFPVFNWAFAHTPSLVHVADGLYDNLRMLNFQTYALSNFALELEPNAILKLANGVDESVIFGWNLDNVSITGGIIDGNSPNQTPPPTPFGAEFGMGIAILTSRNITVKDVKFKNNRLWSCYLNNVDGGTIRNLHFDTGVIGDSEMGVLGAHQDGLHLLDCRNIDVDGLYGVTGDDFFAVDSSAFESFNIVAKNIVGSSKASNMIHLYSTLNLHDVTISVVHSSSLGTSAIRIQPCTGVLRKVSIRDFQLENWNTLANIRPEFSGPAIWVEDAEEVFVDGTIGNAAYIDEKAALIQLGQVNNSTFNLGVTPGTPTEVKGLYSCENTTVNVTPL
jgi:hypothetical protein